MQQVAKSDLPRGSEAQLESLSQMSTISPSAVTSAYENSQRVYQRTAAGRVIADIASSVGRDDREALKSMAEAVLDRADQQKDPNDHNALPTLIPILARYGETGTGPRQVMAQILANHGERNTTVDASHVHAGRVVFDLPASQERA